MVNAHDKHVKGGFVRLNRDMLTSDAYRSLNHCDRSLLTDIAMGYWGTNNGQLQANARRLGSLGWHDDAEIAAGVTQLIDRGLLFRTCSARPPYYPALYALGWAAIDEVRHFDYNPDEFFPGSYVDYRPLLPRQGEMRNDSV